MCPFLRHDEATKDRKLILLHYIVWITIGNAGNKRINGLLSNHYPAGNKIQQAGEILKAFLNPKTDFGKSSWPFTRSHEDISIDRETPICHPIGIYLRVQERTVIIDLILHVIMDGVFIKKINLNLIFNLN